MKKIILGLLISMMLVMSVSLVMANRVEKRPCDDWPAATCLYTPSGNIHVWYNDDHAICVSMEGFNEKSLEKKLANGWYESASKGEYICRWSMD